MLSRVANNLYWMSRYIERAENTARLVDVNLQLLLDFRNLDDTALNAHWMPIVQSSGDEELFRRTHPRATGPTPRSSAPVTPISWTRRTARPGLPTSAAGPSKIAAAARSAARPPSNRSSGARTAGRAPPTAKASRN